MAEQQVSGEPQASDAEVQECPVCYTSLDNIQTGRPEGCEHRFCLFCIQTWAGDHNTCPVDRQEFGGIEVFNEQGEHAGSLPLPERFRGRGDGSTIEDIEEWNDDLFASIPRTSEHPLIDWGAVRAALPESERNRPYPSTWNPSPAGASSYDWWATSGQGRRPRCRRLHQTVTPNPSPAAVTVSAVIGVSDSPAVVTLSDLPGLVVETSQLRAILDLPDRETRHRRFDLLLSSVSPVPPVTPEQPTSSDPPSTGEPDIVAHGTDTAWPVGSHPTSPESDSALPRLSNQMRNVELGRDTVSLLGEGDQQ